METTKLAETDAEILACFPVLRQLHEYLIEDTFVTQVRRLESSGYRLLYLSSFGVVQSVAGFHLGESFAWRKYLYVDDLVTDGVSRSNGYGAKLIEWLASYAKANACEQLHLDTRVTRYATHKFYLNQGLFIGGYHFLVSLNEYAT